MNEKRIGLGLLGILGIWCTAGFALPYVKVLNGQSAEQLLAIRGYFTAFLACVFLGGKVFKADRYTYLIALVVPFASLGLYKGIRAWGVGPTMIVLTATPVVNFFFAQYTGKKIAKESIFGLLLMFAGVTVACWSRVFSLSGFLWSVFATLTSGLTYELFARAKSPSLVRCFWGSLGIGTIGLIGSLIVGTSWKPIVQNTNLLVPLVAFAFIGGFLYWYANLLSFDNLPTVPASILAQGETPAVMMAASLLVGESHTYVQWSGVFLAWIGAAYVVWWLQQDQKT